VASVLGIDQLTKVVVPTVVPTSGSVSGTMVEFNVLVPTPCLACGSMKLAVELVVFPLLVLPVEWSALLQTMVDGALLLRLLSVPTFGPRVLPLLLLLPLPPVHATAGSVSNPRLMLLPTGSLLVLAKFLAVAPTIMAFNAGVPTLSRAPVDGLQANMSATPQRAQLLVLDLVVNTVPKAPWPTPTLGAELPRLPGACNSSEKCQLDSSVFKLDASNILVFKFTSADMFLFP